MLTDTLIEDVRWEQIDLKAIAEQAATAVLRHQSLASDEFEISILACDDARIAALNADFRSKSKPTNVLSWPSEERSAQTSGAAPQRPSASADPELGDIAIAFETCAAEAAEGGKSLRDHATHLIVHAVLHLLGYDHIRDADATLMETIEVEILGKLGLSDPYEA